MSDSAYIALLALKQNADDARIALQSNPPLREEASPVEAVKWDAEEARLLASFVASEAKAKTYSTAFQLARQLSAAGNRAGADRLMAKMLWMVEAKNGGFIGLTDNQLRAKVAIDPRLNMDLVSAAQYAPSSFGDDALSWSSNIAGEA